MIRRNYMKHQYRYYARYAALVALILCAILLTNVMAEGQSDMLFPEAVLLNAEEYKTLEFDQDNTCLLKFTVPSTCCCVVRISGYHPSGVLMDEEGKTVTGKMVWYVQDDFSFDYYFLAQEGEVYFLKVSEKIEDDFKPWGEAVMFPGWSGFIELESESAVRDNRIILREGETAVIDPIVYGLMPGEDAPIYWESMDDRFVTVQDGVITAVCPTDNQPITVIAELKKPGQWRGGVAEVVVLKADAQGLEFKDGDFVYIAEPMAETCTIIGYNGKSTTLEMPLTAWNGFIGHQYDVAAIGENAFAGNSELISVNIDWIETVGKGAFSGCANLKEVTFEMGTSVEEYAFSECPKLTTFHFGHYIEKIGAYAFYNCKSLAQIFGLDQN